jgi:hypothetical protein
MNESIADIEALTLKCRSEQSKIYIYEATICYRAGAYRAAIVSTWIAVVFDLIDKIKELSLNGNQTALSIERNFQTYINQINAGNAQGISKALEFEREIITTCRDKLQFFDQQQLTDIYRLREDRHRCAHPSFQQAGIPYMPSAEQARLHIRNAVVHVLSQPPMQGKERLAELRKIINSQYFPSDIDKAALQLKSHGLERPSDALYNSVVDSLVFGYMTPTDELYKKQQVIVSLNAIYSLNPGFIEDRLGKQLSKLVNNIDDGEIIWSLFLVVNINNAWYLLDESSKDKLKIFISTAPFASLIPALPTLGKVPDITTTLEKRIQSFSIKELESVISFEKLNVPIRERAIALLSESYSFETTNTIFNKAILPIFSTLSSEDVRNIIQLPTTTSADMIGANSYYTFINKVRENNIIAPEELDALLIANKASYLVSQ